MDMGIAGNFQVVVLLGGEGTRLREVEPYLPKAMVDVHGRPFFFYQLELMRTRGFRRFLFCIGYGGARIRDYFGDGSDYGVEIAYSSDGERLLGTGGALRNALDLLDRSFLVIYGDSYMNIDYDELIYFYQKERKRGRKALMAVYRNQGLYDQSNVIFRSGEVVRYDKRKPTPEMDFIDYGVTVMERSVIEALPENRHIDLSDIYGQLAEQGILAGYEVRRRFYEIGRPESLAEFKEFMARRLAGQPAIFLDRDGTLNEIAYNEDTELPDSPLKPHQLRLLPGVPEALKTLKELGYLLIVITNQPAAAKGKATLANLYEVNNRLLDLLAERGVELDGVLICPHHPVGASTCKEKHLIAECDCRKPKPGLFLRAVQEFKPDLANSYAVGDSHVDILAGRAIGVTCVLIGAYKCDTCRMLEFRSPDLVFDSLVDFARHLEREREVNHALD